jgi:hypothetical protein
MTLLIDRDVVKRSVILKDLIDDLGEDATTEAIPIEDVSLPPSASSSKLTLKIVQRSCP